MATTPPATQFVTNLSIPEGITTASPTPQFVTISVLITQYIATITRSLTTKSFKAYGGLQANVSSMLSEHYRTKASKAAARASRMAASDWSWPDMLRSEFSLVESFRLNQLMIIDIFFLFFIGFIILILLCRGRNPRPVRHIFVHDPHSSRARNNRRGLRGREQRPTEPRTELGRRDGAAPPNLRVVREVNRGLNWRETHGRATQASQMINSERNLQRINPRNTSGRSSQAAEGGGLLSRSENMAAASANMSQGSAGMSISDTEGNIEQGTGAHQNNPIAIAPQSNTPPQPVPLNTQPVPAPPQPAPLNVQPVPAPPQPAPLNVQPVPAPPQPAPLNAQPVPVPPQPAPLNVQPVPAPPQPAPLNVTPLRRAPPRARRAPTRFADTEYSRW